jgi:energy-coupling factor transporter ATP-binding protein EcfA2
MNSNKLDVCISHRIWQEALAESYALILGASPGEVVCITGPSRIGKSRLISELTKLLTPSTESIDEYMMLCLVVVAINSGPNGGFSTKSFTQRMLTAARHPILSSDGADHQLLHKIDRTTEGMMRLALERTLSARGTKFLFIDEAQHARYAGNNTYSAHAVLDSWKCLAHTAGLVLVLVGAYPILNILKNSPHLLGRKHQVHMPRYRMEANDISEFHKIVSTFKQHLDFADNFHDGFLSSTEFLYQGSLGCIGLLRAWLMRAQAFGNYYRTGITLELLQKSKIPDCDLLEIEREISQGEDLLFSPSISAKSNTPARKITKPKSKPFQKKPQRRKSNNRM